MLNISLQQITYFLAVVESKNITAAANALGTSQSTISKSILSLEKNLALELFRREKRNMYLTEAGKQIYESWKIAQDFIYQGINEAHLYAGERKDHVRIGALDSHNPNFAVFPITQYFHQYQKTYETLVENAHGYEITRKLAQGELDAIFMVHYDESAMNQSLFCYEQVAKSPMVVCMHKKNKLAHKPKIFWKNLKDCDWIICSARYMPSYWKMIYDYCAKNDFQPKISKVVDSANSMIYNHKNENEIFICDRFWRDYGNDAYVWKEIEDAQSYLMLEYRRDNEKPQLRIFLEAVKQYLKNK